MTIFQIYSSRFWYIYISQLSDIHVRYTVIDDSRLFFIANVNLWRHRLAGHFASSLSLCGSPSMRIQHIWRFYFSLFKTFTKWYFKWKIYTDYEKNRDWGVSIRSMGKLVDIGNPEEITPAPMTVNNIDIVLKKISRKLFSQVWVNHTEKPSSSKNSCRYHVM